MAWFVVISNLVILLSEYGSAVSREACFAPFNWKDCGAPPKEVLYYYRPGSRCEVAIWKGCLPNINMFHDEYECIETCIFRRTVQADDYHHLDEHDPDLYDYSYMGDEEDNLSNETEGGKTEDNVTDVIASNETDVNATEDQGNGTEGNDTTPANDTTPTNDTTPANDTTSSEPNTTTPPGGNTTTTPPGENTTTAPPGENATTTPGNGTTTTGNGTTTTGHSTTTAPPEKDTTTTTGHSTTTPAGPPDDVLFKFTSVESVTNQWFASPVSQQTIKFDQGDGGHAVFEFTDTNTYVYVDKDLADLNKYTGFEVKCRAQDANNKFKIQLRGTPNSASYYVADLVATTDAVPGIVQVRFDSFKDDQGTDATADDLKTSTQFRFKADQSGTLEVYEVKYYKET